MRRKEAHISARKEKNTFKPYKRLGYQQVFGYRQISQHRPMSMYKWNYHFICHVNTLDRILSFSGWGQKAKYCVHANITSDGRNTQGTLRGSSTKTIHSISIALVSQCIQLNNIYKYTSNFPIRINQKEDKTHNITTDNQRRLTGD